jgi:FKBP-type peptidyl-prolyl cis-trans isomerase
MRKILIVVVMAALTAPVIFAQSHSKSKPFRRMLNPHGPGIVNIDQPSKVTGEGVATPSGLRYWDIQTGEGESAMRGHAVKVQYRAWVENGKEFASSISDGRPPIFTLGAGQVIRGWEEGVEGMKVGGRRQLRIPPELAYGATAVPPLVPPNATLIFDVELVGLQ